MPAHVLIELDVSPPRITFGEADRLEDGRVFVPYGLDEPALIAAEINGYAALLQPDRIVMPALLQQGGYLHVRALARDDVDNAAVRTAVLGIPPVTGRVAPGEPGNWHRGPRSQPRRPDTGHPAKPDRGEAH